MVELVRLSSRHQPQRAYKWRVVIQEESIQIPPEVIVDCSLPFPAQASNPVHQGGTNEYYPGFIDVGQLTLTMVENTKGQIVKHLQRWKRRVQRSDELFNYTAAYKRNVYCQLLNQRNVVRRSQTCLLYTSDAADE